MSNDLEKPRPLPSYFSIHSGLKQHRDELAVISRLVLGYNDIERRLVELAVNVGSQFGLRTVTPEIIYDPDWNAYFEAIDSAYRTKKRAPQPADKILFQIEEVLREPCNNAGVSDDFDALLDAVRTCKHIRNRYAHGHWAEGRTESGLFFAAPPNGPYDWLHVDLHLLAKVDEYFGFCPYFIGFLSDQLIAHLRGELSDTARLTFPDKPRYYNPRTEHRPDWLHGKNKDEYAEKAAELDAFDGP